MQIKVKIEGVDAFVKTLQDLGINRIPNYVARGITAVADKVQDAMIQETTTGLTVRGTWLRKGTKYGINRKAATKNDLTAEVSSRAPWLFAQETETTHTPQVNTSSPYISMAYGSSSKGLPWVPHGPF